MATFDLEEQEQIDELKQFWRSYGKLISMVVVVVIVGLGAFKGVEHFKKQESQDASVIFAKIEEAQASGDAEAIRENAAKLLEAHGGTHYAALANLILAKTEFEAGNLDEVIKSLSDALDGSKDPALKELMKLRLAAAYLEIEDHENALNYVSGDVSSSFAAQFADMRGDIEYAKGDLLKAREGYSQALSLLGEQDPWRDIVQIKIDSLGGK
jgi:predicted negative regulator of RcsB-dependent stress response